jgi:hypothetical protein
MFLSPWSSGSKSSVPGGDSTVMQRVECFGSTCMCMVVCMLDCMPGSLCKNMQHTGKPHTGGSSTNTLASVFFVSPPTSLRILERCLAFSEGTQISLIICWQSSGKARRYPPNLTAVLAQILTAPPDPRWFRQNAPSQKMAAAVNTSLAVCMLIDPSRASRKTCTGRA